MEFIHLIPGDFYSTGQRATLAERPAKKKKQSYTSGAMKILAGVRTKHKTLKLVKCPKGCYFIIVKHYFKGFKIFRYSLSYNERHEAYWAYHDKKHKMFKGRPTSLRLP